jgi:hypothetical protein
MIVTNFDDLGAWAEAFAVGEFRGVIVVGRRGLSKTTTFTQAMAAEFGESDGNAESSEYQIISARLSAFELYRQAYLFRDKPLLIDDVDALLADRQTVALLKALLQDELPRRVSWFSNSAGDDREIPNTFFTSSPVCILANDIGNVNANLEAVMDRCKLIEFKPSVSAVLDQCRTWFDDAEVLAFVDQWEPFIADGMLTMRQLKHAKDLRASTRVKVDWQAELLQHWGISSELIAAARVRANKALKTKAEKVAAFQALGGGSPATLYRLFKLLDVAKGSK